MAHVALHNTPLSLDAVFAQLRHDDAGAVVIMIGCVRNHTRHNDQVVAVAALHYEAYEDMAVQALRTIATTIEQETPGVRMVIEHRFGDLAIGDIAVIVGASSPHRAEAFAATRAAIEELKRSAPIWKRETGDNGVVWVGMGP
jgi:molybdopterin synthase catalytic subunit